MLAVPLTVGAQGVAPGGTATPSPAQSPAPASQFVGSDACKTCHIDIWSNFFKNPHYKSIASGKEPPERTGCESCHGPGQAHIAAGGGKSTIPRAFSLLSPRETMQVCLTCHEMRQQWWHAIAATV